MAKPEMVIEVSESNSIKFTYGAIVFVIGLVIAASAWMTVIDLRTSDAHAQILEIKEDQDGVQRLLVSIDKRLARIEILLEKQK